MPAFESATAMVMVGAGSRYENRKNNGISHFLEHMAFKGTQKRPSAQIISSLIDGVGGEFNAFTSKEITGYFVKAAANHVELCLDVLSDMLQHSKLDQGEIDKEKGVILEERNLYEDTPSRHIFDIYEMLLYGDTPLGWDTVGTEEVIRSISKQNFVDYMGSLYSPDNITVVVAGGVGSRTAEDLVEKYFADMESFDIFKFKKQPENQLKPALSVTKKNTEQVHIGLGFRTVSIHSEEKHILSVLSAILGGGMSSRLFSEVREKRGLAYYVKTGSEHYQDVGHLTSFAGLDPKRVEEGISVIVEQYAKISGAKSGLTQAEVDKAKEFLKGHFVLELEDSRAVAGYFAQGEILEDKIETPEEIIAKVDAVTLEQIQAAAQIYFKQNQLNLAIIGNFEDRQRFEKLLKF